MKKLAILLGTLAFALLPLAANAQSCTQRVLARYHYQDANGSDHGCTVTQYSDCSVWTVCAG
jgi:hypothetical protein